MQDIGTHALPPESLADVVKHLYCIQTDDDFTPLDQHLSPSLEIMLIFSFGTPLPASFGNEPIGKVSIKDVGLVAPLRKMLNYQVLPGTDLITVAFNPTGFYRLFQIPVNEMPDDEVIDPDELLGITGFRELWEILKNMRSTDDRIRLLHEYGETFTQTLSEEAEPLLEGVSWAGFAEPSKVIAVNANLSERTIQMRFKKYLGFSTKELTRFLRFKQVIDFIQKQGSEVDWLTVVDQFGYYDQSHLIKDFQHYLNTTPKKFVQEFLGKEFCVSRPA